MTSSNDVEESNWSRRNSEQAFYYIIKHPRIFDASEIHYMNKQYRSAVLDSFIELENIIKEKSNYPKDKNGKELIGVKLMREVFNLKKPLLKWNSLETQTEIDEYEGYSHIFAGSILGIRNPKAHRRFDQTASRALNLLALANLLAEIVDQSHYSS